MQGKGSRYTRELFVSYARADSAWVKGYLLPSLGLAESDILIQDDFRPGQPLANEFERAVSESHFTAIVLSPAYLADEWTMLGEALATYVSIESHAARLIPLVLSEVELPIRLKFRVQLDCQEQEHWPEAMERLRALLEKEEPGPEEILCPYPGMLPYSEENSKRYPYYGREELVQATVERLRVQRLLSIIGPSGSGKTSFLYAGIIPRLTESRLFPASQWQVLSLRPGPQPLHKLAGLFAQHLSESPVQILAEMQNDPAACTRYMQQLSSSVSTIYWLLIIDQFEEVFSQCKQPAEKQGFFASLQSIFRSEMAQWRVLLSIRADFYSDCQESILWHDIESTLLNLPPLSRAELRRAIIEPARSVGVELEAALVERLIDDAEGQKGPLPLLQETLVLMWSRFMHRRLLTLQDYEALGTKDLTGLEVALGRWADSSLTELHEESQRAITRRIFLRLIEFGSGRNDTRRQQHLDDLYTLTDEKEDVQPVLEHLVKYRLVTVTRDELTGTPLVDLAHEKIIESWPQLGAWLEAYHTMEANRRSLVLASTTWNENGRDTSYLLSGKRLQKVIEWATEWEQELSGLDKEFLSASRKWDGTIRRRQWFTGSAVSLVVLLLAAALGILGSRELIRQKTGSTLVNVDAGSAIIGSDDPQGIDHDTFLAGYRIEKYEVSNRQYRACVEHGPCEPPINRADYDVAAKQDFPIVWVSAAQANTYCQWLGRKLPTSVEWERAVRGTDGRLWPWGNNMMPSQDFVPPDGIVAVNTVPETRTRDADPIYHLMDNVSEWVVRVTACDLTEACNIAWDGKTDIIGYAGGAYDRYIERVSQITNASPNSPDPSIGFRCATDKSP